MAYATYHLIDGHSTRRTENGDEIIEVAMARGFSSIGRPGEGGYAGVVKLQAAMNPANYLAANRPPVIGEPHPARPTATLREIIPEAVSSDEIRLTFIYRDYDYEIPTIDISSNSSQIETNKGYRVRDNTVDDSITDFKLTYTFPTDYKHDDNLQGSKVDQGAKTTRLYPEPTITITQKVLNTGNQILDLAAQYVGTVNIAGFKIGQDTYQPDSWLCKDISATSSDTVRNWTGSVVRVFTVSIVFSFRSDGWFNELVFVDGNTGHPPANLIDGTRSTGNAALDEAGAKTYSVYEQRDFNFLLASFNPQIIL